MASKRTWRHEVWYEKRSGWNHHRIYNQARGGQLLMAWVDRPGFPLFWSPMPYAPWPDNMVFKQRRRRWKSS